MQSSQNISIVHEGENHKELPSIKGSLLKPRNLAIIAVASVLLNIILLCAAISASRGNDTPAVTPIPTRPVQTGSPTATSRPTPGPSQTPEQQLNSLQTCFRNCNTEDLIAQVRFESLKVTDIKSTSVIASNKDRNCYGNYLETSSPDKEYNAFFKYNCPEGFNSTLPSDNIHITDDVYILNSSQNWNLESKPRISQIKLIRVIDELRNQQIRISDEYQPGVKYKKLIGSGQTINEFNQLVNKSITLTVNDYLEVVNYSITIEKISRETGYFFDRDEKNTIEKPI